MKLMDSHEMLEVTDADREARLGLAQQMAPLYQGRPAAWLAADVASKRCGVHQVTRGAVVLAVFWAWYSASNETYVVNAAGSLVKFDISSDLFAAIEAAARIKGAKAVQFQTARRGLVEKAQGRGYIAEGVVLSKRL
jgi:hypothetical protein